MKQDETYRRYRIAMRLSGLLLNGWSKERYTAERLLLNEYDGVDVRQLPDDQKHGITTEENQCL